MGEAQLDLAEYEFKPKQEKLVKQLAAKMLFVAYSFIAYAALFLAVLDTSALTGPQNVIFIGGILMMLGVGIWTNSKAVGIFRTLPFRANHIPSLMRSLELIMRLAAKMRFAAYCFAAFGALVVLIGLIDALSLLIEIPSPVGYNFNTFAAVFFLILGGSLIILGIWTNKAANAFRVLPAKANHIPSLMLNLEKLGKVYETKIIAVTGIGFTILIALIITGLTTNS